ncbi:hypothetical protein [Pleionea sp. CnH1-48]|uniref:hypothetical protein n=1 Tax=Pleionea sp. CnH1-48 TaxID=2954494 RepID=UPI002097C579|nr:hypothetical protein [Pleionea sp. CnH1-48]MCO7224719.1 hypothetical protein [Pleionea sp. CnH1-48]
MNNLRKLFVVTAMTLSGAASAVPWCHGGTIVEIANISWTQSGINTHFTGPIPGGVVDPQRYIAWEASHNYAGYFAGGGGWGNVPGKGQVRVRPYAPYTYTNMVSGYHTSQGLSFKLDKCYATPPLVEIKEKEKLEVLKPLDGIDGMERYWRQADREVTPIDSER